ncbi:hypothetical protein [Candidatus Neptunochlamydia vexilliferae]|uniref:Lipoprotein n=1 Tax=Candidatus Neptunichlamydia vexilliferae TaxID=1651774 RepID=A0ABS0AYF2_9BACT|nr:hypothetical protein [Candidatus Neptunochlamydia vexilliferae]MBF5059164.1 hypothetical protein [Candidatus Neptunochlamydia vexilliferae]
MMKKTILLFAGILTLAGGALASCSKEEPKPTPTKPQQETPEKPGGPCRKY